MAISHPHYNALRELHRLGELPQGGTILEIGEANFYDDMPLDVLLSEFRANGRDDLAVLPLPAHDEHGRLFAIAKVIYSLFFQPTSIVSIDFNGTPDALPLDLNGPIQLGRQFETVINHGTAEHVFNIANVFKVMHDHCAVGGLMIHESPFTGWVDHGFYNLQPTLFYDVAAVNGYDVRYVAIERLGEPEPLRIKSRERIHAMTQDGTLPNNAMLFVVMRKSQDAPFRIPMQGYYAGSISGEAKQAWSELR